jgi:pSer/pThr/pTyr-binding forkhead associated (FHA) protein
MAEKDQETTKNIIKLPPSLIVDEGSPDFGVYPLMEDETTLGRSPDSDIQLLHDRTISRLHLKVIKTDSGFRIKDLNSANGTFLNGKKITELDLRDNDLIQIGQTSIYFRLGSGETLP